MARPVVYHWNASEPEAICKLQSTVGAANLVLNGLEVNSGMVSFPGVLRSVSLFSANNLSGVNFTVTGTYGNVPVTYTMTGPTAGATKRTAQLFSTVTSVSVDAATNAVSVGSGTTGQTNWFKYNNQQTYGAITVAVDTTNTVDLVAKTTLDEVNTNPTPYLFNGLILSANNADSFVTSTIPFMYATIQAGATTTGSFTATFLQIGIT